MHSLHGSILKVLMAINQTALFSILFESFFKKTHI